MELKDRRKDVEQGHIEDLKEMKAGYVADLKDAEAEEAKAKEKVEEEEQNEVAADLLKKALSSAKTGALNAFIVDLLEAINANLTQITEGDFQASLDLKRDSLVLTFANASTFYNYATFSRGERVRIAKAVQIALAQVTNAGLIIEDEGFSGLDPAGVSPVIDFMLSSGIQNLFFISHDSSVSDYLDRYPVIRVTKENEVSTAEIV